MERNKALVAYFGTLSDRERIAKSRDIRETLEISQHILTNWRRERTELKKIYFDKIIEIVGVDLYAYIVK